MQSNAAVQLVAPSCHPTVQSAVLALVDTSCLAEHLSSETKHKTPPLLRAVRTHVGMLSLQIWVTSFVKRRMSLAAICTAMQHLVSTSRSVCSRFHDPQATMVLSGYQNMACANE